MTSSDIRSTSSAHPMDRQIRTNRIWVWGFVSLVGMALLGAAIFLFVSKSVGDGNRAKTINLTAAQTIRPVLHTLRPTTTVRAEFRPSSEAPLDAISTGLIIALHVENGDRVKQGDTILTIGNLDVELDILAREGQIEEQLTLLDGQQIDIQKSLLNLQSNIQRLEYDVIETLDEVEQNETLLSKDIIAPEALKRSTRKLEQVRRQLSTAEEAFELETRREVRLMRRQADVLKRSRAQQSRLEEQRESLVMKAGLSGVVTGLESLVGSRVQQGQRLAVIIGDDDYNLEADVNEFFLDRLRLGNPASVRLDNTTYPATLVSIDPNVSAGVVMVEFEMDGQVSSASARAGRSAVVDIELQATRAVLTLPVVAIDLAQNAGGILPVQIGNKIEQRPVTFGRRDADRVEILSGLRETDNVVLGESPASFEG